jgi:hypothetical protein
MRTLGFPLSLAFSFLLLLASGCATLDAPKPLTGAEIVELAKSGKPAPAIIEELRRTGTVLTLQASDIVALHESGVPREVLDYLQQAQLEEARWRERNAQNFWYGIGIYRGFDPYPLPPRRPPRSTP